MPKEKNNDREREREREGEREREREGGMGGESKEIEMASKRRMRNLYFFLPLKS